MKRQDFICQIMQYADTILYVHTWELTIENGKTNSYIVENRDTYKGVSFELALR